MPIWVPLIVGAVSAAVALIAWRTSVANMHSAYRPVVRVAPQFHGVTRQRLPMLLLKNYGRGPAIGVALVEMRRDGDASVIASVDALEPLGGAMSVPDNDPWARVGRLRLALDESRDLKNDRIYRLLYEDLAGRWYETRFRCTATGFSDTRFYLPPKWYQVRRRRSIPQSVKRRAHFSGPEVD